MTQPIGGVRIAGSLAPQPQGYRTYNPHPLPPADPDLMLDRGIMLLLSEADRALAELKGAARTLPNPDLFVAMYVRKEAVLSSQIEGTQSSLEDVLKAEAAIRSPGAPRDVNEVLNYVQALNYGLRALERLPVSGRLIREIHAILMTGVRGGDRRPGEFRNGQVHIGPEGASIREATFIPPAPTDVEPLFARLEDFMNNNRDLPPLVRVGLAHAQFETIHPFHDGNGRTGRLLITFLLAAEGLLDKPVLYLSHYFRARRQAYYDALQGTRDQGDFEAWLRFFLSGVAEVARQAATVAGRIIDLREHHRDLITGAYERGSKHAFSLLDFLFAHPFMTAALAAELLQITPHGARRHLLRFAELGIVTEVTGYGRNRAFEYAPYRALFSDL